MSLAFAMNLEHGSIVAGDGRITNARNRKIIKENHEKVKKLTDNSVLYISGMQDVAEMVRQDIEDELKQYKNPSFEIINDLITKYSLKYHKMIVENKPELFENPNETTVGSVLACFDGKARFSGFSHLDGFTPKIFDNVNNIGFRGMGQSGATRYLKGLFQENPNESLLDAIYKTYRYISKSYNEVGGMLRIYFIDRNGVRLKRRDDIKCLQQTI